MQPKIDHELRFGCHPAPDARLPTQRQYKMNCDCAKQRDAVNSLRYLRKARLRAGAKSTNGNCIVCRQPCTEPTSDNGIVAPCLIKSDTTHSYIHVRETVTVCRYFILQDSNSTHIHTTLFFPPPIAPKAPATVFWKPPAIVLYAAEAEFLSPPKIVA